MLQGVIPIVLVPFDDKGRIDERSLRRVVRFELEAPIDGLGIGGFASEAYKLTDQERMRCAEVVTDEVNDDVPLIIGISPGSTEAGVDQARFYSQFKPAALMVLPPCTMTLTQDGLIDHYVSLADAADVHVMVQQSPHIPAYAHSPLTVDSMAEISGRTDNVAYFKIEGQGSVDRMKALHDVIDNRVVLFGGGGGITWLDELRAGAAGVIPGCGFNEIFVRVWKVWQDGQQDGATAMLQSLQPLLDAVSGKNHEFSVHARKHLLKRAGIIDCATVRRPTDVGKPTDLETVTRLADTLGLRISK